MPNTHITKNVNLLLNMRIKQNNPLLNDRDKIIDFCIKSEITTNAMMMSPKASLVR